MKRYLKRPEHAFEKIIHETYWLEDTYSALFVAWDSGREVDEFIPTLLLPEDREYVLLLGSFDEAVFSVLREEGLSQSEQKRHVDGFYDILEKNCFYDESFQQAIADLNRSPKKQRS